MKATGITRLLCDTDGKHYMIGSCALTSGIPLLGSLKLLKAHSASSQAPDWALGPRNP